MAAFRALGTTAFTAPIVEAKRRIYEVEPSHPDCVFDFEFPDFCDANACIASKNIEAWGNELLYLFRHSQEAEHRQHPAKAEPPIAWLVGKYDVVRRDPWVLSVRYKIEQMCFGAVHRSIETRVQNFLLDPFQPITLEELLAAEEALSQLAEVARAALFRSGSALDRDWVISGTAPRIENFSCFTVDRYGFEFIFGEYQVACYAAGEQRIGLPFDELSGIFKSEALEALTQHDS